MKRWLLRITVLLAVGLGGYLLWSTLGKKEALAVRVEEVARGRVEEAVTNSQAGTVRARRRARLSPELGGQAVEIPYREGETAPAGAVLLRIDDSLYQARLRLARGDLATARAEEERACLTAERAAREWERVRRLGESGIVSTDLADQIRSQGETAEAAPAALVISASITVPASSLATSAGVNAIALR